MSRAPRSLAWGAMVLTSWCLWACGAGRALPRTGPSVEVGVNSDITWGIPRPDIDKEVRLIAATRVGWVRVSVDLSNAEYHRAGQLEAWYVGPIDATVRSARRAGVKLLMELDRAPYWASADPHRHVSGSGEHWNPYWRYRDPQTYARIVSDVVRHYSRLGVHAYELWNEPNYPSFWPSGVDPAAYTRLLKAAYPAVKRADPAATVVMGGLSNLGSYRFLQGMYDAGARGTYDVANFHVYPQGDPQQCEIVADRPWPGSLCLLQGLRHVMLINHDRVPVWVTEFGWSTCAAGAQCVTAPTQARYIKSAYRMFNTAPYQWVQNAFVYEMHDVISTGAWGSGLPVLTKDFRPKPGYYALAAVGHASRQSVKGPIVNTTP